MKTTQLHIATESFSTNMKDGTPAFVGRDQIFWGDHELVRRFPQFFKVSDEHFRPEIEDASNEPGSKRGERV